VPPPPATVAIEPTVGTPRPHGPIPTVRALFEEQDLRGRAGAAAAAATAAAAAIAPPAHHGAPRGKGGGLNGGDDDRHDGADL
jgi:hypothetical protein